MTELTELTEDQQRLLLTIREAEDIDATGTAIGSAPYRQALELQRRGLLELRMNGNSIVTWKITEAGLDLLKDIPVAVAVSEELFPRASDVTAILEGQSAWATIKGVSEQPTMEFTLRADEGHPMETIPMILTCPSCGERHIDEKGFEHVAHHTHACQHCGFVWRPAKVNTHGVRFLPGYKNED